MNNERPNILEVEYDTSEHENRELEFINPDWDDSILFSLVAANQEVPVVYNGEIMTLSEAILAHPGPWVPENETNLISEIHKLLANRILETEAPEEEEVAAKNEETKLEKEQTIKTHEAAVDEQIQKVQQHMDVNSSGTKINESIEQISTETGPKNVLIKDAPKAPEILENGDDKITIVSQVKTYSAAESSAEQRLNDVSAEQPTVVEVINEKESQPTPQAPTIEIHQTTGDFPIEKIQIIEEHELLATSENEIEIESSQPEVKEIDSAVNTVSEFLEMELEASQPVEIEVAEITHNDEEDDLETADDFILGLEVESEFLQSPVIIFPEQTVQFNSSFENIEDIIVQLTEKLEASEPETIEFVNDTLDKIAEVSLKIDAEAGEFISIEPEIQEEIEDLFIELFDILGEDYEPELLESLTYLTIRNEFVDKKKSHQEVQEADVPQTEYGTHEIISGILSSLSIFKKVFDNAGAIGKSALRLYYDGRKLTSGFGDCGDTFDYGAA